MIYHSQIEQDKYFIENVSNYKRDGVFLDVGAHDGVTESNTYTLEKFLGWTGICIEANPLLIPACITNRPNSKVINATVWDKVTTLEIEQPEEDTYNSMLTRIANIPHNEHYFEEEFKKSNKSLVRTSTLGNLLGDSSIHFDYVSIDIEGAELQALKGVNWKYTTIDYMTVEWGNRPNYLNQLIHYLLSVGYRLVRINNHDVEFCAH